MPASRSRRIRPFVAAVIGAASFALLSLAPAGCAPGENIVDQDDAEDVLPVPVPEGRAARLRLPWDAHDPPTWPAAGVLAEVSGAVYLSLGSSEDALDDLGFDVVERFSAGSAAGAVLASGDVTVVAFRGTEPGDAGDWLADLDLRFTRTDDGTIHRGFQYAYEAVRRDVRNGVRRADSRHLWVTGHSLGGAMAVACAYDLLGQGYDVQGLVTFGQPAVVRAGLAEHLDRELSHRYIRFVNGADIVPRVPPLFRHCGSLVWFADGGVKRNYPRPPAADGAYAAAGPAGDEPPRPLSEAEFRAYQESLRRGASPATLPDGTPTYGGDSPLIRDHGMDLYLQGVRRQTER